MSVKEGLARLPGVGTHVPALDGLRGLAILFVMTHHFFLYGTGLRPRVAVESLAYRAALTGWFGVDLFFVLSGFLITGILYDSKHKASYFRSFYMRRILRIFPLYYGFLVVFFVVFPLVAKTGAAYQELRSGQLWYWTYLVNIDIAINGWPKYGVIGHFWSLAVEEQFYLFWPLVVFFFRRRTLVTICLVFVLAAIGTRIGGILLEKPLVGYVTTPARMDALGIGSLLALWARGPKGLEGMMAWIRPSFWISLMCVMGIVAWQGQLKTLDPVVLTGGYTILAVLFGSLLMMAILADEDSPLGRILCSRAMTLLGRYSYALYIFHHPVIVWLRRSGFTSARFPKVYESHLLGQIIVSLAAGSISLGLAILSWYLWESQFLKLKRLFPYGSRSK